mgnify:CR=1 FL=1
MTSKEPIKVDWKLTDGSTITITPDSSPKDKIKVYRLAIKTLKGEYPSINDESTIDKLLYYKKDL